MLLRTRSLGAHVLAGFDEGDSGGGGGSGGGGDGGVGGDDGEGSSEHRREMRTAKRKAKKMRKRLKRLVHATNTMGAAVSAKEQTTTQLALCMQLGLTLGLRHQRPAANIRETDAALSDNDPALVLQVGSKAVEDGSHLPAFKFIVHAPLRFERVRAAWGLSLKSYTESFGLNTDLVNAIASHELLGQGLAENTAEADMQRVVSSKAVRTDSASSAGTAASAEVGTTAAAEAGASSSGAEAATDGDSGEASPSIGHRPSASELDLGEVELEMESEGEGEGEAEGEDEGELDSGYDSDGKMGTSKLLPSTTSLRVISTVAASGKSSSWFFCSKDSRFLVKTCTATERDVLLNILGEYSKHAAENRSTSMLPQYYGLYTIQVGRRSAHFIIMNYWFATMHEISVRYDLKGSTKGRRASAKERQKGASAVLKDLDFLDSGCKVENRLAEHVKRAVEKDVKFLQDNRLIDYSMMLGLHYTDGRDASGGDDGERATDGGDAGESGDGDDAGEGGDGGCAAKRRDGGEGNRGRGGGGRGSGGAADETRSDRVGVPSPGRGLGGDASGGGEWSQPPSPCVGGGGPPTPLGTSLISTLRSGPFGGSRALSEDGNRIFQLRALETPFGLAYLGIIDILTEYTAVKKVENCCFGKLFCGADISCQPPQVYARRFNKFIDNVLVEPVSDASGGGEAEDRGGGGAGDEAGNEGSMKGAAARSLEVELAAVAVK